jgi:2-alkenal reductase
MTDRPRFDVDDTTSSYSPPPSSRPRWVDQGWGTTSAPAAPPTGTSTPPGGTAVRPPGPPPPTGRAAPGGRGGGRSGSNGRRGIGVVGAVGIATFAGIAGAALTVAALGAAGYLVAPGGGSATIVPAASDRSAPVVMQIEQSDIIAAVQRVSPAVVTITSRAAGADIAVADPFTLPATGVGSGVIFSNEDDALPLVLTARHVVCGADALTVKLLDGREFPATTYGIDTLTDLAIVRIDAPDEELPVARVGDSSTLQAGQVATAIGSPMGTYTNSVTSGVISATGRDVPVAERCGGGVDHILRNLIQTDAAINPGNSGGPLIDASGRVIGISTAVAGDDSEGIGFAVPVNIARPIMDQAAAGLSPLMRPWIGVRWEPVTPTLVSQLDLPVDYGVLVSKPVGSDDPAVIPDSPAAAAGVMEGDLIIAINEERVDAAHPLDDLLSQYRPEEALALSVLRDGQSITLRVTLGTRPASQ